MRWYVDNELTHTTVYRKATEMEVTKMSRASDIEYVINANLVPSNVAELERLIDKATNKIMNYGNLDEAAAMLRVAQLSAKDMKISLESLTVAQELLEILRPGEVTTV